jgi:hypothetical protein
MKTGVFFSTEPSRRKSIFARYVLLGTAACALGWGLNQQLPAGQETTAVTNAQSKAVAKQKAEATSAKKNKAESPKAAAARPTNETKVVITGSYIPRTVKRSGSITDAPFQVEVFDANDIQRSGASTTAEFLRKRVPGSR